MLKALPTLLIVTAVALAIWMVAEAESVRSEPVETVLAIESAGLGGRIARPASTRPWTSQITLDLEGSASALDRLKNALPPMFSLSAGRGLREQPGVYDQDLRDALSQLEPFRSAGVTIRSVSPPVVAIEIAEEDSREVPVEVDLSELSLDGTASVEPARVTIRGPREVIARLTPQSRATVRLAPATLATLVPGRAELVPDVRILPPAEISAADLWGTSPINPPTARVSVTIRAQTRSYTIPSVNILIAMAPVELRDWDLEIIGDDYLTDVTVTGSRDVIDQFESRRLTVEAFVRPTFQELEAALPTGVLVKQVQFGPLPQGVTARTESTRVELRVHRRTDPSEPDSASQN